MPPQQTKGGLLAKLGDKLKKAHEAHKNDETNYGIVNLPEGISGGVAQLVMVKCAEHPKGHKYQGQPYVTMQGIAKSPPMHNGQKVAGLRVSQSISLCDQPDKKRGKPPTPVTFADNYADLLNELRKFGVNTAELPPEGIEAVLQALEQQKPFFCFSTRGWTPEPTPQNKNPERMVFTQFDGVCEDPNAGQPVDAGQGFADSTGTPTPDTSANGTQPDVATGTTGADADGSMEELGAAADNGDKGAMAALRQIAVSLGIEEGPEDGTAGPDTVNGAPSWAELAGLIVAIQAGGGTDETTGPTWTKGDVVKYVPRDAQGNPLKNPKTKQPMKQVQCEIMDVAGETATLKSLADGKSLFKNVKLEYLEANE